MWDCICGVQQIAASLTVCPVCSTEHVVTASTPAAPLRRPSAKPKAAQEPIAGSARFGGTAVISPVGDAAGQGQQDN